ncbi:MAG: hypothetical protein AMS22_06255 [Thiotrichales bacterium SG8_50]|nr:MAG: hypothetical protein AMS22_06255 [Thiotrichales bacterium SG8_50]
MNVEKAYDALREWSAARALNHLLYTFKAASVQVEFCGAPTYIIDLAKRVNGDIPARLIPLRFRGGPFNSGRKEYRGTLLALLVDELFHQHTHGCWDRVEKFLEAASA